MKKVSFLIIAIATLNPIVASATLISPKFAIDPASPTIDGLITPDDVLQTGPAAFTEGSDLGLQDDFFGGFFDNLNALSYGQDPIDINRFFFSVDRGAVGLPGTDVNTQAQPGVEEAAGDIYQASRPSGTGTNSLFIDEEQLGLTPGFFGDDIDALELDTAPSSYTYFSIDFISATNGFGTFDFANDILVSNRSGGFGIYAEGVADIGLLPGDDLDALALLDRGTIGQLDPGLDIALFSISTFSTSTLTYSPADILITDFNKNISVWASAADIGLRSDDELNALDTTVPEPATFFLMVIGLGGMAFFQYRFRKMSSS